MAYEVWWALVLGFAISAMVQAWVPRQRIEGALAGGAATPGQGHRSWRRLVLVLLRGDRDRPLVLCQRAPRPRARWPFSSPRPTLSGSWALCSGSCSAGSSPLAEFVGGLVMIALMAATLRLFVSPRLEARARANAREARGRRAEERRGVVGLARRLGSTEAWGEVGRFFVRDWRMLWKEITIGFLLAGFIGLLGDDFFNALFIEDAPTWSRRSRTSSSGHWSPS